MSPIDDTFLSGSMDKTIRLWDLKSPNCQVIYFEHIFKKILDMLVWRGSCTVSCLFLMNILQKGQNKYNNNILLQTTQPTVGLVVTAVTNCCANYVKTSHPPQWGPNLSFLASRSCGPGGWLALLLINPGDVERNPGRTITHKQVWICDICNKQMHDM